jgi:YVTN family beta-propeller protein
LEEELLMLLHKKSTLYSVLLTIAFLVLGNLIFATPKLNYHLLKKIPLGAAPGGGEAFDYLTVDDNARRVYLSHGTEVKVIDADSGAVVGTISNLKKSHGVALVKELGKGFITDEGPGLVIFDLASLKVTGEIKTSGDSDSLIYDPTSKHIFTFNQDPHDTTVIDPAKGSVVRTIPLGGAPEFAAADDKGMIYDNIGDTNEVVVIDSGALMIKARWPTAPAGAPTGMAVDSQHRRLFSSGSDPRQLVMMDADNGKVIQSVPISAGADANVYEPATRLLFVSTREGKVHIFHEDSPEMLSEVETVTTEYGAKTMTLDPRTHNIYLTTADFGPSPAPTAEHPHPRRVPIPGTFRLLIYGR